MSRELMIPKFMMPWDFFERQRSLFTDMYRDMEEEFKAFDSELEHVRNNLFQLEPFDTDSMQSSLLEVENPIVSDNDGNKKLALRFDVSNFKPEEIEVKAKDHVLYVHAKHEENTPDKKVFREFSKQYTLPKTVDPEKLKSIVTNDGVLHIEGPAPEAIEPKKERLIPIEMAEHKPELSKEDWIF